LNHYSKTLNKWNHDNHQQSFFLKHTFYLESKCLHIDFIYLYKAFFPIHALNHLWSILHNIHHSSIHLEHWDSIFHVSTLTVPLKIYNISLLSSISTKYSISVLYRIYQPIGLCIHCSYFWTISINHQNIVYYNLNQSTYEYPLNTLILWIIPLDYLFNQ